MRSLVSQLLVASAVLLATLVWASVAVAAPAVNGIFPLATELETNNKIAAGPDGNMWVTLNDMGNEGEKDVASITPAGVVTEYELPNVKEKAFGIAAGPEGRLWVPPTNHVTSFLPMDP